MLNHSNDSRAASEEKEGDSGMSGELTPARRNIGTKDEVTHRGYQGGRVHKIGNTEEISTPSGTKE